MPHYPPIWTAAEDATAKEAWAAGLKAKEIGPLVGRSRAAVLGRMHRLKQPKRPNPTNATSGRSWDDAMFIYMWDKKETIVYMAARFGCTDKEVRNHARKLGLRERLKGQPFERIVHPWDGVRHA